MALPVDEQHVSDSVQLALFKEVVEALSDSLAFPAVARQVLAAIAQHCGWMMGTLWTFSPNDGQLHCDIIYQKDKKRTSEIAAATSDFTLELQTGLPGRVWGENSFLWLEDLSDKAVFSRAEVADRADIHGAVLVPIRGISKQLGVMEFLTDSESAPDRGLEDLMLILGQMVGQYLERQQVEEAVRTSEVQKSGILSGVASGVLVVDNDGKFLFANDAAASLCGLSKGEEVIAAGRNYIFSTFEFLDEAGAILDNSSPVLRALGGSLTPTISLLQMRARTDGTTQWLQVKATPALSEDGVASNIIVFDDVTAQRALDVELQRSHDELQAILEGVTDAITATDANGTVIYLNRAALLALGFESMEQFLEAAESSPEEVLANINILDEEGLPVDLIKDEPGAIVRSGVSDSAEATWRYHHRLRGDSWALTRASAIRDQQGKLLMVLSISEDITTQKERETKLRAIAETLQASILPDSLPPIPGIELGAAFTPRGGDFHEVGGDFYDVFALSDGQWLMLTGDVCGKGPEAAAVTSLCRYAVRALALREPSPAALLGDLNEVMLRHRSDGRFATVAICRLSVDDKGAHAVLALGGHPQPLVLHADGSVESVGLPGTLVGAVRVEHFGEEEIVHLQPGDALIFYTDGVTEARDPTGAMFDLKSFLGQCQGERADEMARHIQQAVLDHQGEHAPYDDVALLVARVSSGHIFRQRYRAEAVSVPQMREALEILADRYPQLAWDEIKLMATELATNSIVHGLTEDGHKWVELVVAEHEESLRVSIIGGGDPFSERAQQAPLNAVSGRGLMLVDTLADRWGVDSEHGICVWFESDLVPEEDASPFEASEL